jgi:hypothetical protein
MFPPPLFFFFSFSLTITANIPTCQFLHTTQRSPYPSQPPGCSPPHSSNVSRRVPLPDTETGSRALWPRLRYRIRHQWDMTEWQTIGNDTIGRIQRSSCRASLRRKLLRRTSSHDETHCSHIVSPQFTLPMRPEPLACKRAWFNHITSGQFTPSHTLT